MEEKRKCGNHYSNGDREGFHLALFQVSSCLFSQLVVAGWWAQTSCRWCGSRDQDETCCWLHHTSFFFKRRSQSTARRQACRCCMFPTLAHAKPKLPYTDAIYNRIIYKLYRHLEMGMSNSVNELDFTQRHWWKQGWVSFCEFSCALVWLGCLPSTEDVDEGDFWHGGKNLSAWCFRELSLSRSLWPSLCVITQRQSKHSVTQCIGNKTKMNMASVYFGSLCWLNLLLLLLLVCRAWRYICVAGVQRGWSGELWGFVLAGGWQHVTRLVMLLSLRSPDLLAHINAVVISSHKIKSWGMNMPFQPGSFTEKDH